MDTTGSINFVNQLGRETFGLTLSEVTNGIDSIDRFIHPEDRARAKQTMIELMRSGKKTAKEYRMIADGNREFQALVRSSPIVKNGEVAGVRSVVDDISMERAMQANLAKHQDWILDARRFALAKDDCKIMHALPADRNNEITDEVLDSPNSIIYDEAENRLHTAKGVLNMLISGAA